MTSECEIRRLLSVQSTLEARVARSISVGRWLWGSTAEESAPSPKEMERGERYVLALFGVRGQVGVEIVWKWLIRESIIEKRSFLL